MTRDINDIANSLAQNFVAKEEQSKEFSAKFRADEQARAQEVAAAQAHLNGNGRAEFNRLAEILKAAVEKINETNTEKLILTGGGDHSYINIQHEQRVLFLYFKYLRTNGDGTGPCIECFFGNVGENVGNNGRGLIGRLIPYLDEQGQILWGEEPSSARNAVGSVDQVAAVVLPWFQTSQPRLTPGSISTSTLQHVRKLHG